MPNFNGQPIDFPDVPLPLGAAPHSVVPVRAVKYFHIFTHGLSTLGVAAAVLILLGMTGLILTEVVLRTFFAASTYAADELVGYGVGGLSFLALGHSLERNSLIRMNLLISRLGPKGPARIAVEILCTLLGILSCSVAFFFFVRNVVRNYERGYVSETVAQVPLWIPEAFVAVGLGIFVLQLVSHLLRVVAGEACLDSGKAAEPGSE